MSEELHLRVITLGDCSAALTLLARSSHAAKLEVQTVATADQVVPLLRFDDEAPIDLMFVDAESDQPAYLDLCRTLKEHPETVLLPVIAVGRTTKRRIDAFAAGADDYVTPKMTCAEVQDRVYAQARAGQARRRLSAARLGVEVRRVEEVRQTFRRYLSPQLADRILGDVKLRDNAICKADLRMRAVVMFADMRGFTSISEHLSPSDVVPLLNEFFSLLTQITFHNDGTVFSIAGDCMMAAFGVPLQQSDSFERAMTTARQMLVHFSPLAAAWNRRLHIETGLGIGINEGEIVAGNVGSPSYMNYTMIGDTVNVASRLSERARAGEVLFSGNVKRALDARGIDIGALELPPIVLRGRSNPIDIFCVPRDKRLYVPSERPKIIPPAARAASTQ